MIKIPLFLLLLFLIFFIPPTNCQEENYGIVQGTVKGFRIDEFESISNAKISVFKDGELISKNMSNLRGKYFFNLPPGVYMIRASAEGFVNNTVSALIESNSNQTIDLFLPREGEDYKIKLKIDNFPSRFLPRLEIDGRSYGVALNDTNFSFQKGTGHNITIVDNLFVENKTRYILEGDSTLAFNKSTVITFQYVKQYLIITDKPSNLTEWYGEGALLVTDELPELINFYNSTQLVFKSWFIDNTPIDGNPITVIVNRSFQVSYEYQKQYFLKLQSKYGNVTGSGWYDEGAKAVVDIFPLEIKITHMRIVERSVVFVGWKGDVESSYPHIIITMDSPKIIRAEWTYEEHLEPIYRAIVEISLLICFAKILGGIFSKFNLPEVLGELLAGIMLGPYALGSLKILGFQIITLNDHVMAFADIGAIMVLFVAGLGISFAKFRRIGLKSLIIGTCGVVIPLILGSYISRAHGYEWNTCLIIGAVLAATSIAITVKTLEQIKEIGSEESDVIINSAVIDDVLAIAILAVVVSIITTGVTPRVLDVGLLILKTLVFWLLLLLSVAYISPRLIGAADRWQASGTVEAVAIALCFGSAVVAIAIGLSPIIGAFAAGMALASSNIIARIRDYIGKISLIFSPIFFAVIGAELNLRIIGAESVSIILILLAIAILSKIIGCGLPAMVIFKNTRKGLRVGISMVSRGEVGLIIAGIGITSGVLTQNIYAGVIGMVALTTIITPILMKQAFSSEKQIVDEKE